MSKTFSTRVKDAFDENDWSLSEKKEVFVKACIEKYTDHKCIMEGFGAGETGRIEESSGEAGFEKSAPDIQIADTDICVEVTGPLHKMNLDDDLFVNVYKAKYALKHPEREYWLAHVNGVTTRRSDVRIIRVGEMFFDAVSRGEIFREQFQSPRGYMMYFHVVPIDHDIVITFDRFIQYLRTQ